MLNMIIPRSWKVSDPVLIGELNDAVEEAARQYRRDTGEIIGDNVVWLRIGSDGGGGLVLSYEVEVED